MQPMLATPLILDRTAKFPFAVPLALRNSRKQ